MEIYYSTSGNYGLVTIVVPETNEIEDVKDALDSVFKALCATYDYEIDEDANEIYVYVEDYYEFLTLRKKLLDHCEIA